MSTESLPANEQPTEDLTKSKLIEVNDSSLNEKSSKNRTNLLWVQSFFIRTSLVLSIFLIVLFTIRELTDKSFTIQPFSIPAEFVENGYTGDIFASIVLNNLNEVIAEANERRTLNELDEYGESSDKIQVKLEVSGVAISPEAISSYLKRIFGINQRIIGGAIVKSENSLELILNISGNSQIFITQKTDSISTGNALRMLALKAAEEILKEHNHLLAGLYFYAHDNYAEAIQHFRAAVYEQPEFIGTAYAHWGDAVLNMTNGSDTVTVGKLIRKGLEYDSKNGTAYRLLGNMYEFYSLEKAERYYRKSIEVDPTSERSWYRLARNLNEQMKNDKEAMMCYQRAFKLNKLNTLAIEGLIELLYLTKEYDKAYEQWQYLEYLVPNQSERSRAQAIRIALSEAMGDSVETLTIIKGFTDKRSMSYALNSIAFAQELRKNYKAGFRLVELSIMADSSFSLPYTTLAELCGLTSDKEGFYHNLEIAIQKGLPVAELTRVEKDEPYRTMASEEKYKKLKEKYK